eukprot:SAG22_NODE_18_length_32591_cov_38.043549_10_plen_100_part_00
MRFVQLTDGAGEAAKSAKKVAEEQQAYRARVRLEQMQAARTAAKEARLSGKVRGLREPAKDPNNLPLEGSSRRGETAAAARALDRELQFWLRQHEVPEG